MSFLEQYEAFLKFNHDQIQRRFNGDTTASCKFLFIRKYGKCSEILNTSLFLFSNNLGLDVRKPSSGVCEQHRRRLACTYMQSDQHLCYSLIGKNRI